MSIKSSQAYTDKTSLKTIIDKKRKIAFIIPKFIYKNPDKIFLKLKENNIKWLKPSNPLGGVIIYRKSVEKKRYKITKNN